MGKETLVQKYEPLKDRMREMREEGWQLKPMARELQIRYDHLRYLLKLWNIHSPNRSGYVDTTHGVYINLDEGTHAMLKKAAAEAHVSISRMGANIINMYLVEYTERVILSEV